MSNETRLPVIQEADLAGKVVLLRVDHNVVKGGKIKEPDRIDRTFGTIFNIVERGGRPILMSHVGRPKDKKTGQITCDPGTSTEPIARYLEWKLNTRLYIPTFHVEGKRGILAIDTSVNRVVSDLKQRKIGGIYLPNTRWFEGEEAGGQLREAFAQQLAGIAHVFVNDAPGSWQPHASTFDVTRYLPSYAGFLMQEEIGHLDQVLSPVHPFVAIVAGAKYDTKIGPLTALYKQVDKLILGGVIYNAYLAAKYNVKVAGVSEEETQAAKGMVAMDREQKKIVELPHVVEADAVGPKTEGGYRTLSVSDLVPGQSYGHILDIAPESYADGQVAGVLGSAKTIFINAVMGLTPHYWEGTEGLDRTISRNKTARKLFAGGDTLQEFKALCPDLYLRLHVQEDPLYYFFTGGGAVLKAIEQNDAYGMEPVKALLENRQGNAKG
jgi:phosphoglycerate kinase